MGTSSTIDRSFPYCTSLETTHERDLNGQQVVDVIKRQNFRFAKSWGYLEQHKN